MIISGYSYMIRINDDMPIPTDKLNLNAIEFDMITTIIELLPLNYDKRYYQTLLSLTICKSYTIYKPNHLFVTRYNTNRDETLELVSAVNHITDDYINRLINFKRIFNSICNDITGFVLRNHSVLDINEKINELMNKYDIDNNYNTCLNPETYVYYKYLLNSISNYRTSS